MKVKSSILILIALSAMNGFFSSCEKEYLVPVPTVIPDSVHFTAQILPIFNAHCNTSGCHTAGGIAPDLSEENAYGDLFLYDLIDTLNPASSVLYERMTSNSKPMPPGGKLKSGEAELILAWIEQGAKND